MFQLDVPTLTSWMYGYLWPLFRVAGFMAAAPIFGTQTIPSKVRVFLAMGLAALLAPILPASPAPDGLSLATWLQVGAQTLIGIMIGFSVQILFQVFTTAGQILAIQMGLGFASVNDPVNGLSVVALGQFYMLLSTVLFLLMNGHLTLLQLLANSFIWLPVGQWPALDSYWMLADAGTWLVSSALSLALPGVIALLLVNFSLGIITKAAPQLNIFAVGFAFLLMFGLFIFWVGLSDMVWQQQNFMLDIFDLTKSLFGAS